MERAEENIEKHQVLEQTGEDIDIKIESLKTQERVRSFEKDVEHAGDILEKIVKNPVMKDEALLLIQKDNFWKKTKKLRTFLPLAATALMSLAGLFNKGEKPTKNFEDTAGMQSWANMTKVMRVMGDLDEKQNKREKDAAHPFETKSTVEGLRNDEIAEI